MTKDQIILKLANRVDKLEAALLEARRVIAWENEFVKQTTGTPDGGFLDAIYDIDKALSK